MKQFSECSYEQMKTNKDEWVEAITEWNETWNHYRTWVTNPVDFFGERPDVIRYGIVLGDKPIAAILIAIIGVKPKNEMTPRINLEFIVDPEYINREVFQFLTVERLQNVVEKAGFDLRLYAYYFSMLPATDFNEKLWDAMKAEPSILEFKYEKMHFRKGELATVTVIIIQNPLFNEYHMPMSIRKIFAMGLEFGQKYDAYMKSPVDASVPEDFKEMVYDLFSVYPDGKEHAAKVLENLDFIKRLSLRVPKEELRQLKKNNKSQLIKTGIASKLLFKGYTDMEIMKHSLYKIIPKMLSKNFRLIKFHADDEEFYKNDKYVTSCLMKIFFDSFTTPGSLAMGFFDVDPKTGKVFMNKLDRDTLNILFNLGFLLLEYKFGPNEDDKIILCAYGKVLKLLPSPFQLMGTNAGDFLNLTFSRMGLGYILGMFLLFTNNVMDAYEILFIEVSSTNAANINFFTKNKIKIFGTIDRYTYNPNPDPRLLDENFDALKDKIPQGIANDKKATVGLVRGYVVNELYSPGITKNYEKAKKILEPLQISGYPVYETKERQTLDSVAQRKTAIDQRVVV